MTYNSKEKNQAVLGRVLLSFWGVARVPRLGAFLPEAAELVAPAVGMGVWDKLAPQGAVDTVAGWGHKKTAALARAIARKRNLPYVAVEDGFLRSFGLGVEGAPPLSLVVDRTGIYYDSTGPSDLENILAHEEFDEDLRARARAAIDWIRAEGLTKYNQPLPAYTGGHIRRLIIDQTAGDASVLLSGAPENAFEAMIDDALRDCAAADIAVKLHPDTLSGKRGGYLRALAESRGIHLIDKPVDGWSLLDHCDEVATISSQFGFDALMAGKRVLCYGLPFYAGWGVTYDKISSPRRIRRRSVEEIFAAAYIRYARYVDPYFNEATTLENVIAILSDRLRQARKNAQLAGAVAIGFSPWKRMFLKKFIGPEPVFGFLPQTNGGVNIVWGLQREDLPPPVVRMEDGFIRSRGLGVKLARPWSLVADHRGIYFDPRQESDLEHILQTHDFPEGLVARAARVRQILVDRDISKYNVGQAVNLPDVPKGRRVILVPGQVETDASIRAGTVEGMRKNINLLRAARAAAPDAFIIYKPHPDVETGKRIGAVPLAEANVLADVIARDVSIGSLWPIVDEVHTLTSLAGFEGLLRGKKISTYGKPFYAGWGLTEDTHIIYRRTRVLTLDQLVAGALILYPFYFDWKSGASCNIETVIRRFVVTR